MPSIEELLQDLDALNQCYEMESRHRKQWYETARKRGKELAAQQQEIERLRGENAELLQENVRLLTPTHDEFRQLLAAQRQGVRPVDKFGLAYENELVRRLSNAVCKHVEQEYTGQGYVQRLPMDCVIRKELRRHLEPQGEPNERDEVPVSQELPSVQPERQVSAGDVAGQAVPDEAEQRLAMAQGRNREGDSTRYPAPQAVAPASPLVDQVQGILCERYVSRWGGSHAESARMIHALYDAELAALRKQVEEGEKDTKRLDWLAEQKMCRDCINYPMLTTCEGGRDWRLLYPVGLSRRTTIRPNLREALDASMSATPESKEPA
jgi:hypothetical protein